MRSADVDAGPTPYADLREIWDRRNLLRSRSTTIFGPCSPGAASPAKTKFVYLLADQWRASATGYAGDPNLTPPSSTAWPTLASAQGLRKSARMERR